MYPRIRIFALVAALAVPCSLLAQGNLLLALSKQDQTLALVDPATLEVMAKVPVGSDPHEVIASADGATAYVSNYGGGTAHTLAVVDLRGRKAMPSIELGALTGPHGLAFVGGRVWFTAEGAKAIGRFDPATERVDLILGTGQNRTHMVYVAGSQQHIVTTNVNSGTVSLIDREPVSMPPPPPGMPAPRLPINRPGMPGGQGGARFDWNETVVKVGKGSEGFDVSPDAREIWVANAEDGTISVISRETKAVVQTFPSKVLHANRLKFTPDGRYVLVSDLGGPDLVVFEAATRKAWKRVALGHGAAGILVEPSGGRAFVACTPDNYVAVVDLASFTVTGHIAVGDEPDGLAWAAAK